MLFRAKEQLLLSLTVLLYFFTSDLSYCPGEQNQDANHGSSAAYSHKAWTEHGLHALHSEILFTPLSFQSQQSAVGCLLKGPVEQSSLSR